MILSERELGISEDHEGIITLSASSASRPGADRSFEGWAPGTPLAEVLPIQDAVLELDLNPNRVDCLGVYGVAREVHAITGAPLAPAPWERDAEATGEGSVENLASVRVDVPDLCPRFTARAFTGVRRGASPLWMKARLSAAGQRPISNVVDVTNYVMLLTAQPLHAFDLDRVPGGELIIRRATEGERMTTLDGVERELDSETVLVCDRKGPTGIAGIMGGQVSEVSDSTTSVLLEVATWNGPNILRTSSMLGLRSDASARYEKQLHPELAIRAQRVASRLLLETAGATLVPGTLDVATEPPAPHVVSLHGARLDSLLGVHVDRDEAAEHLRRLGFELEPDGEDDMRVVTPVHRHYDVTREADVIEEVGRLHGFDRLPRRLPAHAERVGGLTREQRLRRRAEDVVRDAGFDEIVAWHLLAPDFADRLRLGAGDPRRHGIAAWNPISAEQTTMRTTLLAGLLDAARHNLARDVERVALFESGRAYLREPAPAEGGPLAGHFAGAIPAPAREPHRIACLAVGALAPGSWASRDAHPAGFFELKGVLELLARQLGAEVALAPGTEPFLHPGRAARIEIAGLHAGWVGELHPLVARAWDLPGGAGFELDLAPLVAAAADDDEPYRDLTTHPALFQDLAVVVDEGVGARQLLDAVRSGAGELLASAEVFDLYRGAQVGEGRKSLAVRLEFRAPDRTLSDEEVAPVRAAIAEAVARVGGSLRE
jgi:phenylalanyl-tRNA synthetase beta chain